jgi:hypothetical protein
MKFHSIKTLATPLLALALTAAAGHMVLAQDDPRTPADQREQPTATVPDDPDTAARNTQEPVPSDTDCIDLPEGASANAQGAGAANAQGANPQANANARGSRAGENQRAAGAANSNADIASNRDDCLDIRTGTPGTEQD